MAQLTLKEQLLHEIYILNHFDYINILNLKTFLNDKRIKSTIGKYFIQAKKKQLFQDKNGNKRYERIILGNKKFK